MLVIKVLMARSADDIRFNAFFQFVEQTVRNYVLELKLNYLPSIHSLA